MGGVSRGEQRWKKSFQCAWLWWIVTMVFNVNVLGMHSAWHSLGLQYVVSQKNQQRPLTLFMGIVPVVHFILLGDSEQLKQGSEAEKKTSKTAATAAGGSDDSKKMHHTFLKETYSSYIYKGMYSYLNLGKS